MLVPKNKAHKTMFEAGLAIPELFPRANKEQEVSAPSPSKQVLSQQEEDPAIISAQVSGNRSDDVTGTEPFPDIDPYIASLPAISERL